MRQHSSNQKINQVLDCLCIVIFIKRQKSQFNDNSESCKYFDNVAMIMQLRHPQVFLHICQSLLQVKTCCVTLRGILKLKSISLIPTVGFSSQIFYFSFLWFVKLQPALQRTCTLLKPFMGYLQPGYKVGVCVRIKGGSRHSGGLTHARVVLFS